MAPKTPLEFMDDPSVESLITYPGSWWNEPYGASEQKMKRNVREQLTDADMVVVSDSDTDGLGCIAVVDLAYPDKEVAWVPSGHGADLSPSEAMEKVLEFDISGPLYFTDICPNEEEVTDLAESFLEYPGEVHVFDHHEWEEKTVDLFENAADNVDVRPGADVCAANITFENVADRLKDVGEDVHNRMEELVAVTRDHDIWVKEDPRSDNLADYQFAVDEWEYTETVREHGAALLEDDEIREYIEGYRHEKNLKIEGAAKFSEWCVAKVYDSGSCEIVWEDELDSWEAPRGETVTDEVVFSMAYGNAYSSGLGNVLYGGWSSWLDCPTGEYEELAPDVPFKSERFRPGDADVAVLIPPWNKVSFRSSGEYPICDKLAERLNGGGHKKAAGGTPNIAGDVVSYGVHWETKGGDVKEHITEVVQEAFEEGVLDEMYEEQHQEGVTEAVSASIKSIVGDVEETLDTEMIASVL